MRAYLIDPEHFTIEEVDYNGDFHEIYRMIGADCFDAATFNRNGDCVFVDDEGLLKPNYFFLIDGYPQLLAGKGLVLGVNREGESVSPTVTMEDLMQIVSFVYVG